MLENIHLQLADDGCAILKNFIAPTKISDFIAKGDRVEKHAFYSKNPYFTKDDVGYPKNHPIRRFYDRSNGFISADNSILRAIYKLPFFVPFIQDSLQEKEFYRHAKPACRCDY